MERHILRERWGARRKPLSEPAISQRTRGRWRGYELLVLGLTAWIIIGAAMGEHWLSVAVLAIAVSLLVWNLATGKDGRLGESARRLAASTEGRIAAWTMFAWVLVGLYALLRPGLVW